MISFKAFFESRAEGLIPSDPNMSLEDFMKTLEGSTISDVLNKASYIRMFLGNKYGFSNIPDEERNVQDFGNALTNFLNKDVQKHRPTQRAYDTPEFKEKHNYAEYESLDKERRAIFRELLGKSREERKEIEQRKKEIEDRLFDTEFYRAMKGVDREYDEAVKNYHNTPLTSRELVDDGSAEYAKLKKAYNKLMGKEESENDDVIDV